MNYRYLAESPAILRLKSVFWKAGIVLIILLLFSSLSLTPASAEAVGSEGLPTFASVARLDLLQQALDSGAEIVSAVYSDGTGSSGNEFTTTNPDETDELWNAVSDIVIADETTAFVTDWYPSIWFHLSDGSSFGVFFDGHNLDMGQKLYVLDSDDAFWALTDSLSKKYRDQREAEKPDEPESEPVPNVVDLYFPSNPTTGYSWFAETETEGIVEVSGDYFADSSLLGFTGAGGTQWYHFTGISEGMTSVTLSCARSWEEDSLYSFTYRLSVDEDLNVLVWGVEMTGG
ncbi:MAG: protease inhibitor I42 family protein [Oscillospiraceae bacterium]|nr:protease inhibitor I42 family protein [Oscillospiraceae bacterium]